MFTEAELIDAIDQIKQGKHSIQNCERLAAIYTVLDHLYGGQVPMTIPQYSNDDKVESEVGLYGQSEFLQKVAGKPAREAWLLIDELIEALSVLNPRLVSNFMSKLNNL